MDNCTRCGVVFEQVVAFAEIVNCSSMEMQCTGNVPTISIEKSDGCQVSLQAQWFLFLAGFKSCIHMRMRGRGLMLCSETSQGTCTYTRS